MDKFDAAIVGGGLAGLSAAYRLAEAGRQVILLERGDAPGSKNVTGGRIYMAPVRRLLPGVFDDAPFERGIVKEILTITDEKGATQIEHIDDKWREAPYMSYSVLRARFDKWLSEKAMEKGAFIIPRRRVDDLLWEDGRVAGVRAGTEDIPAHVVVAADGALSFMAEKARLRQPLIPRNYAVAVKEIYSLSSNVIEDQFGVGPGEGAANLFMGSVTRGLFGGGFLYTNTDSLSLGIVIGINALAEAGQRVTMPELVEQFESRPEIQRYIKGAELKEYSAHVITEAGINGMSRLSMPGMLVVGDAAGLALNMGVTVRGMEFAIASGVTAAEVVDEALKKGDLSGASLSLYDRRMKESFVIKDMETFRHSREVLENPRLFTVYPQFVSSLLNAVFDINSGPKKPLYPTVSGIVRSYIVNWEGFKDFLSFRKV